MRCTRQFNSRLPNPPESDDDEDEDGYMKMVLKMDLHLVILRNLTHPQSSRTSAARGLPLGFPLVSLVRLHY